jgi:hypothetical protein
MPCTYTIVLIIFLPTAINRTLDETVHAQPPSNHFMNFTSNDISSRFLCVRQFQSPFTSPISDLTNAEE